MGRCLAWHLIVDGVKTESARGGLKRKCLFLGRFRRDSSWGKYSLSRCRGSHRGRRRKAYVVWSSSVTRSPIASSRESVLSRVTRPVTFCLFFLLAPNRQTQSRIALFFTRDLARSLVLPWSYSALSPSRAALAAPALAQPGLRFRLRFRPAGCYAPPIF